MRLVDSMFLFKALIKKGARWEGDISHRKWTERLFFDVNTREEVLSALEGFREGEDYKVEGFSVWIV